MFSDKTPALIENFFSIHTNSMKQALPLSLQKNVHSTLLFMNRNIKYTYYYTSTEIQINCYWFSENRTSLTRK